MTRLPALCVLCLGAVAIGPAAAQGPGPGTGAPTSAQRPITLRDLEAAAARSPDDLRTLVVLGIAYLDVQNFARALETLQNAVRVGPESAEAHNWLGVALSGTSDLPGAVTAFRKAVALDPKYGRAWSNLGSTLAQSGDYAEAVGVFEKALGLEPNSAGAHLNLGMALRETGELERALEHLGKVVANEPGNAVMQYELGQTLRQKGNLAAAVEAFEKAIELDPELREGYYALGVTLRQQSAAVGKPARPPAGPATTLYASAQEAVGRGELGEARRLLGEALALDDRQAQLHNLLGFVLGQQGDLQAALDHLRRAVDLAPESADARYNHGVALHYSGAPDQAIRELEASVRLDPATGAAHAFLGRVLLERNDLDPARVHLQRAISLLPPTAAVFFDLGTLYVKGGDLDKGLGQIVAGLNVPAPSGPQPDWDGVIAVLRAQTATQPDRADTHNVLGLLLGRRGADSGEVAAAFREAIRLHPEFAEAHNNLGLVLLQAGDDQGGIAAFREAVRLAPQSAEARTNIGAALTPTDAEEAIEHLEKAVALAPDSVKAHFNLAVAYGASSKGGQAKEIEQLRKVNALAPTFARSRVALGKALLRDGKVAEAVAELEEAVKLAPDSGEANYQLGLALARAGRREEGAAAIENGRALVAAEDRRQNAAQDMAEGRSALEQGELALAAARFQRAGKLLPDSADPQRHLGVVLERQGNTDGALAAYRRALELNPADVAAKRSLDRLTGPGVLDGVDDRARVAELEHYIRGGRFEEVHPLLAEYVKARPASSWGWYALGYALFAQQKIGESIKALSKSLQLDVTNAEAHKILGRNLMIIGRFDAAQIEFEQGIRYKPDSAEMHYNLGKLFSIQDNWAPARKAFAEAVRLDPAYVEAIDGLGFAFEALGDDETAVAKYREAIALNDRQQGSFAAAHVNLSAFYNRTEDPEQALEFARRAIEIDPGSDRALFQKGRAEERLGRLEDAVKSLNAAIVANPNASSYYYVLAGVYRRLGWMDESRQALEAFKRLGEEASKLDELRRNADAADLPGRRDE